MSNSYISYENYVDDGTVTADSEVGNLPVTNLQNTIIQTKWRTETTSAYFEVDFGSNKSIELLALVIPRNGVMLSSTDTVRHRLDADGGTSGTGAALDTSAVACGVNENYGYHYYKLTSATNARYWKCDINATSLSSYFQIGRAWAGSIIEPSLGFTFGASRSWQDGSVITRARQSGAVYVDVGQSLRRWAFQFDNLTPSEARGMEELQRYAGKKRQVFVVRETNEIVSGGEALIGRMSNINPIIQPNFNQSVVAFDIVEDQ